MRHLRAPGLLAGALLLLAAGPASTDAWRDMPYERFQRALTTVTAAGHGFTGSSQSCKLGVVAL